MPNMTGHAVRSGHAVGHVARVTDKVKATNAAKAGSALKARNAVRARAMVAMKCANPECGHPSEHEAQAGDALIGPTGHRVPVPTVTSRTEMLGMQHIWCPLKTKCPNS